MNFKEIDKLFIQSLPSEDSETVPLLVLRNINNQKKVQDKVTLARCEITMIPSKDRDRNKYEPHIGSKEALRRLKQIQRMQQKKIQPSLVAESDGNSTQPPPLSAR